VLIENLSSADLRDRLAGPGIHLVTGAYTFHLRVRGAALTRDIATMYGAYCVQSADSIEDASVCIEPHRSWRRPFQLGIRVRINDQRELEGATIATSYAALESALNWSIALSDLGPLLVHAAVVERDGRALMLPGPSGAGKSTLCAALVCEGWRLFSDEMAILGPDGDLMPNPRPVSLKNDAIAIIRSDYPSAYIAETMRGTPKGDVAFMRAPRSSALRCSESAPVATVVAPLYEPGAATAARRMSRLEAFRLLTTNAVNYTAMLQTGFDTMTAMAERCDCFALAYSKLDEAIATIAELHARA
jgi:HprK-related kinase A